MANVGKNNCEKANDFYTQSLSILPKVDENLKQFAEKQLLPLFPQEKIKACLPYQ
jgi:hypothetical protein